MLKKGSGLQIVVNRENWEMAERVPTFELLISLNLFLWYKNAYSPYCSPYISYGTSKENLSKYHILSLVITSFTLPHLNVWTSIDSLKRNFIFILGSRDGAVVRALASHQCGPGSTPGPTTVCGLSLLLVLVLVPRGFSLSTLVFPSPQKPTLPNSN